MKKKLPRMTQATKMVLREMLADPAAHYYGLQLIKATALPGGTLYPIMARLEAAGWLTGDWEESVAHIAEGRPPRHYYRFTDDGAEQARDALAGAYRPSQRRQLDFGMPWPDLPGMSR
jgi:PadR family transcriptional regulator, regulatory protein PadR